MIHASINIDWTEYTFSQAEFKEKLGIVDAENILAVKFDRIDNTVIVAMSHSAPTKEST